MEEMKNKIPLDFFQNYHILPQEGDKVAICGETPMEALEDLRLMLNKDVEPVIVSKEEIDTGLQALLIEDISKTTEGEIVITEDETQNLLAQTKDAPVIRLVNSIFLKAVHSRASDIHIEPYENEAIVRIRVDGVMHEIMKFPKSQYASVSSRIKVMAKLNLAEKRLPQDGRMRLKASDSLVDVRVSTVPTIYGERIVLRLLDKSMKLLTLEELGLNEYYYEKIKYLINHPYGILLLTGPTGSGKSTTLYAILLSLKSPFKNIITIEDPVEYQIPGIGQIQVNPKIDLTFANGLRSIVRQDPDIIMVGEIRDNETAEIAIHASLTGHLVLSTLHTNDAPTAISRLVDMNIENYLISSSLRGAIAQRLVRKLCDKCKKPYNASSRLKELGINTSKLKTATLYKEAGCDACLNTGFKGRIGIFEILIIDEEMDRLIVKTNDANEIRTLARKKGMLTLFEDGINKACEGITTVEEVLRATMT
ncbi:MAG: GspE/PulE family protein [Armatimonadota bacterium]